MADEDGKAPRPAYDARKGAFEYEKGKWFPWWAVLILPFLVVFYFLYKAARERVHWRAAWATVLVFEVVVGAAETFSVGRGHWVYNKARILGPTLLNVPIEEHLLYYLFGPLTVITAMHAIRIGLERREG